MTEWTNGDLATIGNTEEVEVASLRADGELRGRRIIWIVALGDDLYVRSVNGPDAAWFRGVRVRHEGRLYAGDRTWDVSFVDADPGLNDEIDAVYRDKYRRYSEPVAMINADQARATTLKVLLRAG